MPALFEGDYFESRGTLWLVVMVNESRARCVAVTNKNDVHEFTLRSTGKVVQFHEKEKDINISPNAEVEVVKHGGKKAVADFLSGSKAARRSGSSSSGENQTEREDNMNTGSETTTAKKNGKKNGKAKAAKKEGLSKCGFIDSMFEKGTHTKSEILEATMKKFELPKTKEKSTMATINARPSHMKAAGRKPLWKEEPKEEKKDDKKS